MSRVEMEQMREAYLLKQLDMAEILIKMPEGKAKQSFTYQMMRVFFRIEFLSELLGIDNETGQAKKYDA